MVTISVITAVYNRVDTIGQSLDSVQSQTWSGVEHVVIDGASTDGTVSVLESRRDHIAVLVSEQDAGIYDALNKGMSRATGDVVGLMHSDDFFADERVLEKVGAAFTDPAVEGCSRSKYCACSATVVASARTAGWTSISRLRARRWISRVN